MAVKAREIPRAQIAGRARGELAQVLAPTREACLLDDRAVERVVRWRRGSGVRPRRWAAGTLVVWAAMVAAWAGSQLGSGMMSRDARFNAERVAAQHGQLTQFGPAAVPGHPGEQRIEVKDLIRRFIALDAVN